MRSVCWLAALALAALTLMCSVPPFALARGSLCALAPPQAAGCKQLRPCLTARPPSFAACCLLRSRLACFALRMRYAPALVGVLARCAGAYCADADVLHPSFCACAVPPCLLRRHRLPRPSPPTSAPPRVSAWLFMVSRAVPPSAPRVGRGFRWFTSGGCPPTPPNRFLLPVGSRLRFPVPPCVLR